MKLLKELEGLVSSKIGVLKAILELIQLETRLAGLSIFPLMIDLFLIFIIILTLWFSAMFFMGYYLFLILKSILPSIASIIAFNLALFLLLYQHMTYNLKNMSFKKTRDYLSSTGADKDEQLTQAIDSQNHPSGQDIEAL